MRSPEPFAGWEGEGATRLGARGHRGSRGRGSWAHGAMVGNRGSIASDAACFSGRRSPCRAVRGMATPLAGFAGVTGHPDSSTRACFTCTTSASTGFPLSSAADPHPPGPRGPQASAP